MRRRSQIGELRCDLAGCARPPEGNIIPKLSNARESTRSRVVFTPFLRLTVLANINWVGAINIGAINVNSRVGAINGCYRVGAQYFTYILSKRHTLRTDHTERAPFVRLICRVCLSN